MNVRELLLLTEDGTEEDPQTEETTAVAQHIEDIRNDVHFTVFGIFPAILAVIMIYLFLRWFYTTFIKSA